MINWVWEGMAGVPERAVGNSWNEEREGEKYGNLLPYKFHTHNKGLKWSYTSQGLTLYWLLQIVSVAVQMVNFCGLAHLISVLVPRLLGLIQQQQQHILLGSLSLTSLLVSFSRCYFQVWGFHLGIYIHVVLSCLRVSGFHWCIY